MQVSVEEIQAELGNNGIVLRIRGNGGKAVGRLKVGRAKLRWYPGKTSKNHKEVTMEKFIEYLNAL